MRRRIKLPRSPFTNEQMEALRLATQSPSLKARLENLAKSAPEAGHQYAKIARHVPKDVADRVRASMEIVERCLNNEEPTESVKVPQESTTNRNTGGRPTSTHWPEVKDFLREEIRKHGFPTRSNPPGWKYQADAVGAVEKFIAGTSGDEVAPGTVRENVRKILTELRAEGFRQT